VVDGEGRPQLHNIIPKFFKTSLLHPSLITKSGKPILVLCLISWPSDVGEYLEFPQPFQKLSKISVSPCQCRAVHVTLSADIQRWNAL
jgi:hypothetical protein